MIERKVHAAIERELIPNGFKEVREEPDLLLITHAAIDNERTIEIAAFEYWTLYQGWKRPLLVAEESYEAFKGMLIVTVGACTPRT